LPAFRVQNLYCCGIKEIHGVQNQYAFSKQGSGGYPCFYVPPCPAEQISFMQAAMGNVDPPRPVWIFSDAYPNKKPKVDVPAGEAVAQYIEEHELGTVTRSGYHKNLNSGNFIQMYTWLIDNEAFFAHKPKF
jgi:hypothetical protein